MQGSRLVPITAELTWLRETHRWVLCWNRFSEGRALSFQTSVHPEDAERLADVCSIDGGRWTSADEGLEVVRDGDLLHLRFRDPLRGEEAELTLGAGTSERFLQSARTLR